MLLVERHHHCIAHGLSCIYTPADSLQCEWLPVRVFVPGLLVFWQRDGSSVVSAPAFVVCCLTAMDYSSAGPVVDVSTFRLDTPPPFAAWLPHCQCISRSWGLGRLVRWSRRCVASLHLSPPWVSRFRAGMSGPTGSSGHDCQGINAAVTRQYLLCFRVKNGG